ncbi:MAG: C1 family peptidase [Sulfobacillus sp.]
MAQDHRLQQSIFPGLTDINAGAPSHWQDYLAIERKSPEILWLTDLTSDKQDFLQTPNLKNLAVLKKLKACQEMTKRVPRQKPKPEAEPAIRKARKRFSRDGWHRALCNAMSQNWLRSISRNHRLRFCDAEMLCTHEVRHTGGAVDQERAGLCWAFAQANVMRPWMSAKYGITDFRFSMNFVYFWSSYEKCRACLRRFAELYHKDRDLNAPEIRDLLECKFTDGGFMDDFPLIVQKYGICPEETFRPTLHTRVSYELNVVLELLLSKGVATLKAAMDRRRKSSSISQTCDAGESKKPKEPKTDAGVGLGLGLDLDVEAIIEEEMAKAYRILCYFLGEPPAKFDWKFVSKVNGKEPSMVIIKDVSPRDFYHKCVPIKLEDFVTICHDPRLGYHQVYQANFGSYVENDRYLLNLPVRTLQDLVFKSICDNEGVVVHLDYNALSCDPVTGIFGDDIFQVNEVLGEDLCLDKANRLNFLAGNPNHAMTIVGVDVDQHGAYQNWKLENSWGSDAGQNGFFRMSPQYFEQHVYCLFIHRRHLTEKMRADWDARKNVSVKMNSDWVYRRHPANT